MIYKYRFTVFTPCYNSEKFIHRVIESLESQNFRNFEWLVINDASSDNTGKLLEEYASKAAFPVRIIHNSQNQMLYYNFNLAFDEARGELMIFAGHDDRFHPETLDIFNHVWKDNASKFIAGISCLCQNQYGKQIGKNFPAEITVSNYFDMFVDYIYRQEKFGCTRTDVLKKYKFDLLNKRIGEGFLWARIALEYQTIYLNKVLRTYYIERENYNALTKSSRKKVAFTTYLSYLDWVNIYLHRIKKKYLFKLRFHFALVFYGLISKQRFIKTFILLEKLSSKLFTLLFFPFAFIVYNFMKMWKKL